MKIAYGTCHFRGGSQLLGGRKLTDAQRIDKAVASVSGKRLMLKEPKGA